MIRCLIVDDEVISRKFLEHFVSETKLLTLVASCKNAQEAEVALQNNSIDLIFLDVEMPDKSGLQLLAELSNLPLVILVTSQEKYAAKAFEYEVLDYLVKPVKFSRFERATKKALRIFEMNSTSEKGKYIFLKTSQKLIKIAIENILYIEAQGDYVQIHAIDKKHIIYSTMSEIFKKLPEKEFSRTHRSYIVQDAKVEKVEKSSILIAGKELPLGVSHRKAFLGKLESTSS